MQVSTKLFQVKQKQKTKVKTKFVDSMNCEIHWNIFFQQKSSFPKFSVKTSCEKT